MSEDNKSKTENVPGRFTSALGLAGIPLSISFMSLMTSSFADEGSKLHKWGKIGGWVFAVGAIVGAYLGWNNSAKTTENIKELETQAKVDETKIHHLTEELQNTRSFLKAELSRREENPRSEHKKHETHGEQIEDALESAALAHGGRG